MATAGAAASADWLEAAESAQAELEKTNALVEKEWERIREASGQAPESALRIEVKTWEIEAVKSKGRIDDRLVGDIRWRVDAIIWRLEVIKDWLASVNSRVGALENPGKADVFAIVRDMQPSLEYIRAVVEEVKRYSEEVYKLIREVQGYRPRIFRHWAMAAAAAVIGAAAGFGLSWLVASLDRV